LALDALGPSAGQSNTALATRWPIVTIAIESADRHLIADRLGIARTRWALDAAEALLQLRTLLTNSAGRTRCRRCGSGSR